MFTHNLFFRSTGEKGDDKAADKTRKSSSERRSSSASSRKFALSIIFLNLK